jgi:hypothetical protein
MRPPCPSRAASTSRTGRPSRAHATAVAAAGLPARPFDVVVTANGRWAFASLNGVAEIAVYQIGQGRMPVLAHLISVSGISPFGEALTPATPASSRKSTWRTCPDARVAGTRPG